MRRDRNMVWLALVTVAASPACKADGDASSRLDEPASAAEKLATSPRAAEKLAALRTAFAGPLRTVPGAARRARASEVLLPGAAPSFASTGNGWLHPAGDAWSRTAPGAHAASVDLAETADGGFRLRDLDAGLALDVRLVGARHTRAEIAAGYVVYERALAGEADVLHRPTRAGTEDYLRFERAPQRAEVRYAIRLGEKVAGLRLVGETLELVDAGGTPRLRMAPPWLVDAAGGRRWLRVAVSGCAVDTDPRGPWGRAPVSPGARECEVRIDWEGAEVKYPALVDPAWTATGDMLALRYTPTAHLLPNGKVLVAGGTWWGDNSTGGTPIYAPCDNLKTAQLYDPASGTWSATQDVPFACATTALLNDGRVLSMGLTLPAGQSYPSLMAPGLAAIYDPVSASWSATTGTPFQVWHATLLTLGDGRVLASGGAKLTCNGGLCLPMDAVDSFVFDPAAKTWTTVSTAALQVKPYGTLGSAVLLADGRALVRVRDGGMVKPGPAALFDPVTNQWSNTGVTVGPYGLSKLTRLAGGKVLCTGGFTDYGINVNAPTDYPDVEIFDPATNQWSAGPSMAVRRGGHMATLLADGRVLVAGGMHVDVPDKGGFFDPPPPWPTEIFDPATMTWTAGPPLLTERWAAADVRLPDGSVLIAGGQKDALLPNMEPDSGADQKSSELYDASGGAGGAGGSGAGGATGGAGAGGAGGSGAGGSGAGGSGAGGIAGAGGAGGSTSGVGGAGGSGAGGSGHDHGACSVSPAHSDGAHALAALALLATLGSIRRRARPRARPAR